MVVQHARPVFVSGGSGQLRLCRIHQLRNIAGPCPGQQSKVRHHAESRKLDKTLRFFWALDGVIELIEQEGQPYTHEQTEKKTAQQDSVLVGIGRPARRLGFTHQIDIRAANLGGNPDFLQALEYAVVELFVHVHFARQHRVLHRGVFEIQRGLLLVLHGRPQSRLIIFGGGVGYLNAFDLVLYLGLQATPGLFHSDLQVVQRRISGFELFCQRSVVGLRFGKFAFETPYHETIAD